MKKVYAVDGYVFVQHPAAAGLWLRLHPCVVVACPTCAAQPYCPCRGDRGNVILGTHYRRRDASKATKGPS